MALTVSTDLSVNTGPTHVDEKLEDKQKALRESIEKGEPKIFGVSQIVIGLLIISYAIPLVFGEATVILHIGVPWWSGIMSVISGAAAITLEKKPTLKAVSVCLAISGAAIVISVIALILYYVDMAVNLATECRKGQDGLCDYQYFATHFNTGVKATISVVSLVQTGISTAFTVMLYNQRRSFTGYVIVNE